MGFKKNHPVYKGSEKGWFKQGNKPIYYNKTREMRKKKIEELKKKFPKMGHFLPHSEDTKNKLRKYGKKLWQNSEYKEKQVKAILNGLRKKPTKPEIKLNNLLQITFPNEYKYTGNGKVIIGGLNPDFMNINGKKKLIELFGDYWHNSKRRKNMSYHQTEEGRINHFKKYGFNCLIIWEHQLKDEDNVINKIKGFDL